MADHVAKKTRQKRERRERAHKRVRTRVQGTPERPRLSVYKSLHFIYAQVIDDGSGRTLAQANSADPAIRGQLGKAGAKSLEAAKLVGQTLAERAKAQGVERVVFDRGGYIYHGKVKAIAEAAREKGLQF
jgi:large subunit ribosomal protein L18